MAKKQSWLTGSAIGSSGLFGGNNSGGRLTSTSSNSKKTSSGSSAWGSISGALGNLTDKINNVVGQITGGEEVDPIAQKVQDYADLLNKYGLGPGSASGSSSSSSGGGYAAPQRIDIQPMIDAFTQAANAQKNTLQTNANQQRTELLNSIKRFQEQTARSQEIQRDSFNSSRADLEEAAFQADRSNRISAAARGIGGSGLQQLSQLQTLMEQNSSISDLAKENTNVQTELAKALSEAEEDTNTSIQNLLSNLANSLSEIDASLGNQIANLQYTENARYEEARQAAMENALNRAQSQSNYEKSLQNSYAQALIDYEMGLREQADQQENYADLVKNLQSDFSDKIKGITDASELKDLRDTYKDELYTLAQDNLITNDIYTSGINYLNKVYNNQLNANKKSTNSNWLNDLVDLFIGTSSVTNAEESLRQQARAKGLI